MLIKQFGLNWPSGSREDCVFSLYSNYLPLEKGVTLHMDKLEPPSHKDSLIVNSLVKFGPAVFVKKIF